MERALREATWRDIFLLEKPARATTMPSMMIVVRYGLTGSSCVVTTNSGAQRNTLEQNSLRMLAGGLSVMSMSKKGQPWW